MTNWKTYKITSIEIIPSIYSDYAEFGLDDYVVYNGGEKSKRIRLMFDDKNYSINNYQIGGYLEINTDKTIDCYWACAFPINLSETQKNIVRKFGSSSSTNVITARGSSSDIVISPSVVNAMGSSQTTELARYMSRMVDENDKEYEFKIEDNNTRYTYSLICRKQK